MTPLTQQVTSLEWSKTLKALGLKQESVCGWRFQNPFSSAPPIWLVRHCSASEEWIGDESYAAYTVAELGEILPDGFYSLKDSGGGVLPKLWAAYSFADTLKDEHATSHIELADTEANARAAMLEYLIKNKLITLV